MREDNGYVEPVQAEWAALSEDSVEKAKKTFGLGSDYRYEMSPGEVICDIDA